MLIVDTYNVLHTKGILPPDLAGPGVPELCRLIARSRYGKQSVSLVCDGTGSSGSGVRMGDIRILFAGRALEADDVIESMIDRYVTGRTLTVVSSDRRLKRAARKRGAVSVSSADFLAQLCADWGKPVGDAPASSHARAQRVGPALDPYSVEAWMKEFGFDPAPPPGTASPKAGGRASDPAGPGGTPDAQSPPQTETQPGTNPQPSPKPKQPKRQKKKTAPPAAFGDRLEITLPPIPDPTSPTATPTQPVPAQEQAPEGSKPADQQPATRVELDPILLAALEEWRDRLSLDDLDMRKWVPDADIYDKR